MKSFLRALPGLLVALAVAGCGSMSDFDQPEVPPPPPPPPAAVAASASATGEAAGDATAEVEAEAAAPAADEFDDADPSALTDFREPLAPYGSWVDDATYGTVWVPSSTVVGDDFSPYVTAGHWSLDANDQWLWVSDYDSTFGWAVFHYGRWVWVGGRGWVWIPGRRYAPAWVTWRVGDPGYGYVGWAPAPPLFYWRGSSVFWFSTYPRSAYVYCPTTYLFHHGVHRHVVTGPTAYDVGRQTRVYATPAGSGPRRALAQPSRGPVVGQHVPASVVPSVRPAGIAPERRAFATPSGMGRRPEPRVASPEVGGDRPGVGRAFVGGGRAVGDIRPSPRVVPAGAERPTTLPAVGFREPPAAGRPSFGRSSGEGPGSRPLPTVRSRGDYDAPRPRPVGPDVGRPSSPRVTAPSSRPSASPFQSPSRPSFSPSSRPSFTPSRPAFSSPRPSAPSRPSFSPSRSSAPSRPSFSPSRSSSPSRPSFSRPSRGR